MPNVIKMETSNLIVKLLTFSVYLTFLFPSGLPIKGNMSMPVNWSTHTITNNGFQIGDK